MSIQRALPFLFMILLIAACTGGDSGVSQEVRSSRTPHTWYAYLNNVGTYSSARTVDLNNDSILDIVIGAGGKEEEHSDTAIIALDGATGRTLWAVPGENQNVGSAVF
ncbi:MAG TPA: hypothetical protein VE035_14960, partial [Puia sp.]|nr:hypothetical protein [Puia sp.]